MTIEKKLASTGSSKAVILSREVRDALGIKENYKMTVLKDKIIIEKGDK